MMFLKFPKLARVPASNVLYAGTVPASNFLYAGTVPASNCYLLFLINLGELGTATKLRYILRNDLKLLFAGTVPASNCYQN